MPKSSTASWQTGLFGTILSIHVLYRSHVHISAVRVQGETRSGSNAPGLPADGRGRQVTPSCLAVHADRESPVFKREFASRSPGIYSRQSETYTGVERRSPENKGNGTEIDGEQSGPHWFRPKFPKHRTLVWRHHNMRHISPESERSRVSWRG